MNKPVKFLFGDDFEQEEKAEEDKKLEIIRTKVRAEFEGELQAAKKQAYEKGFQDGQAEAMGSNEVALKESTDALNETNTKIVKALEILLDSSDTMMEAYKKRTSEFRENAYQLSVAVAEKIAGELVRLSPDKSLEKAFRDTIDYLEDELRISVSVPSELVEISRERIQEISQEHGYSGKLIITDDATIPAGDWKIEWANGGIIRNGESIETAINEVVQRYLDSVDIKLLGSGKAPDTGQTGHGDKAQ